MRQVALSFLYVSVLAAGTYSAFSPTFDSNFARTQAETGDGMLNHYILEHSWRAITDSNYCGTMLAPPFFHPAPWVYWYSETLIGAAPIYCVLRLGLSEDLAYQWWQIVCCGLNFVAFAAVGRWLKSRHAVSILGVFLWAFATSHIYQGMHQQLIPRFWMPLAVYHAWHQAYAPNLRSLNRTVLFTFLQAVTCVYTGWFLAMGLVVFVAAVTQMKPSGWKSLFCFIQVNWRKLGLFGGLWGLAFGAFFAPYLLANRGVRRDYGECLDYLPTWAGWLKGPLGSRWYETLSPFLPPVHPECCLFAGFAFYFLVLIAVIRLWQIRCLAAWPPTLILAASCLITAGIWWVLTLNLYQGVSAWWFVRFLPGAGAIRCVSRVCLIIDLFAVLGAIVWLNEATDRIRSSGRRALILCGVAAAMLFEQTGFVPPSFDKSEFYGMARHYAECIQGADAAYVIPPKQQAPLYTDVLAMWAGLEANVPVVNGYSGRVPPGYP